MKHVGIIKRDRTGKGLKVDPSFKRIGQKMEAGGGGEVGG